MLFANDKIFQHYSKPGGGITITKSGTDLMERGLPLEVPQYLVIRPEKNNLSPIEWLNRVYFS